MTMTVDKVLYTGQAHTTGAPNGASRSTDGRLDIKLSSAGAPGNGTNPEQMFGRWLVGLFHGCDGSCGRQDEGTISHARNESGRLRWRLGNRLRLGAARLFRLPDDPPRGR
jgi:osmotically inducible protein OsmC